MKKGDLVQTKQTCIVEMSSGDSNFFVGEMEMVLQGQRAVVLETKTSPLVWMDNRRGIFMKILIDGKIGYTLEEWWEKIPIEDKKENRLN